MDTPTPAKLPGVSALKGHKPLTYGIVGLGTLVGAWYIHKRDVQNTPQDTTAQDASTQGQDPAYAPTSAYTDGSYYPDASQGSLDMTGGYLGQNTPANPGLIPLGPGSYYDPQSDQLFSVLPGGSGIAGNVPVPITDAPSAGTGGGPPTVPTGAHKPVVVSQAPQATTTTHAKPCPSRYPHRSERGCYRIVHKSGHTWHYYAPHDSPKIRVS